nr:hypothetical protein [Ardenticatena sp.]
MTMMEVQLYPMTETVGLLFEVEQATGASMAVDFGRFVSSERRGSSVPNLLGMPYLLYTNIYPNESAKHA